MTPLFYPLDFSLRLRLVSRVRKRLSPSFLGVSHFPHVCDGRRRTEGVSLASEVRGSRQHRPLLSPPVLVSDPTIKCLFLRRFRLLWDVQRWLKKLAKRFRVV